MDIRQDVEDFTLFWDRFFPVDERLKAQARRQGLRARINPENKTEAKWPDYETIKYQDMVARTYGTYAHRETQIRTMEHILANIQFPKKTMVSLGCGPAAYELWLVSRGYVEEAILVDHSVEMLARAEHIALLLGVADRIVFIQKDAVKSGLAPGIANMMLCLWAIHWSDHWKQWIRESRRLMHAEGEAFFTCALFFPRTMIDLKTLQKSIRTHFRTITHGLLHEEFKARVRDTEMSIVPSGVFIHGKRKL